MNRPSSAPASPPNRSLLLGIVLVSVLVNVALAARLLQSKSSAPEKAASPNPTTVDQTTAPPPAAPSPVDATAPASAAPDSPPLQWSALESSDLRQYIANLRTAGCPEQVIRDIITSDVNQSYRKRVSEIWQPAITQYWQKYRQGGPTAKQKAEFAALDKENQTLLQDLLGTRISRQEMVNTVYLQVFGSERALLFLSEDRRATAMKALADADFESKDFSMNSDGGYRMFKEQLKSLTDVLTPEELDEFRLRNSPATSILKYETKYLNLTPDEYKQLLFAKEANSGNDRTKDLVRQLFGEERAKEFEQVSGPFYQNVRAAGEAEGIPLDRVTQAAKVANDTVKTGMTTINDRSLSAEERKVKVAEIQTQAEIQIKTLLGDKASKDVLRNLRNLLNASPSGSRL